MLHPRIELRAQLPRPIDHRAQTSIAAREKRFQQRLFGTRPTHLQARPAQFAPQQVLASPRILRFIQRHPLKRRVRLGNERARADVDLRGLAVQLAPFAQHRLRQIGNRLHIFQRLAGMADHEVQLDRPPAAREDFARRLDHLRRGNELVDHAPHVLRRRFGRKREAAAPIVLQRLHQIRRSRLDAQRRQRHRQMLSRELLADGASPIPSRACNRWTTTTAARSLQSRSRA